MFVYRNISTPRHRLRTQNLHGGRQVMPNPAFRRDVQIPPDSVPHTPFHLWGEIADYLVFYALMSAQISVTLSLATLLHIYLSYLTHLYAGRVLQIFFLCVWIAHSSSIIMTANYPTEDREAEVMHRGEKKIWLKTSKGITSIH